MLNPEHIKCNGLLTDKIVKIMSVLTFVFLVIFSKLFRVYTANHVNILKVVFHCRVIFYARMNVIFNRLCVLKKIETMYETPRANVTVERGSTSTFARRLSHIISFLFTQRKPVKISVCTHVKITRKWKCTFIVAVI